MSRAFAGLAALVAAAGFGCAAPLQPVAGPMPLEACPAGEEVDHSVFLVGDAGEVRTPEHDEAELPVDPVMRALHDDVVEQVGALGLDRVTVVYLGDNVYPRGLVPEPGRERRRGERVLATQVRAARPARVIFTAGNHDWGGQGSEGWANVREQAKFLAAQGDRVEMHPEGGCAGPARVEFGEHLAIVFVDPLGFGHAQDDREAHARSCPHPDAQTAFAALVREFEGPPDRNLVLALHHPIVTSGPQRSARARVCTAFRRR